MVGDVLEGIGPPPPASCQVAFIGYNSTASITNRTCTTYFCFFLSSSENPSKVVAHSWRASSSFGAEDWRWRFDGTSSLSEESGSSSLSATSSPSSLSVETGSSSLSEEEDEEVASSSSSPESIDSSDESGLVDSPHSSNGQ